MEHTSKLWTDLSKIADIKLIDVNAKKFIRMTVSNHEDIIG